MTRKNIMNLLETTKEICRLNDIWPKRSKGQNFLINERVYNKIIEAAALKKSETVLEVGPGLGFLTTKLAEKVKQVIAVELDDKLARYLEEKIAEKNIDNVEIVNENVLDFKEHTKYKIQNTKYKIVANLPYNITSVFLRKILTSANKPSELVLMLQKEVAERICAKPGDMSLLALSVQLFAEPEIIQYVPKEDFWPSPEVNSAIIQIKIKPPRVLFDGGCCIKNKNVSSCHSRAGGNPVGCTKSMVSGFRVKPGITQQEFEKDFFRLAKIGFSAKRKMLKNNLANGLHIPAAEAEKMIVDIGLDLKIRAEDLGVEDWIKLVSGI